MRKEFLYGYHCVTQALSGRRKVFRLYVDERRLRQPSIAGLVDRAKGMGVAVEAVKEAALRSRVGNVLHQGVVAEVSEFPYVSFGTLRSDLGPQSLVLVLDHLEDPQNLGSLLRTAEAVGVSGVVIPERRAVAVTPAVSHASAGAAEHARIAMVSNVAHAVKELKEDGLWAVGLENRPAASLIWQADLRGGVALVVGSEGRGIGSLVLRECDLVVRIPMFGKLNSLNVAVAGSIALYEVVRQRGIQDCRNLSKF